MSTPPPDDPPTRPDLDETTAEKLAEKPAEGPPPGWAPTTEAPPRRAVAPAPGDGLGTAALVLGLVGLVLALSVLGGIVLGVVALVFGILTLRRVRRGDATNRGQALAGTVLGAVAVVVSVATVVVVLATGINPLRPASLTTAAAPTTAQLRQCVQQAHGDRSAIRACRRQFAAPRRPGTTT